MRLLVCGGRDYGHVPKGCPPHYRREYEERARREKFILFETLRIFHATHLISVLIHGGATGADTCAKTWAACSGVPDFAFPVTTEEWRWLGRKAGPLRNQRMIDVGKPDQVLAFPGGRGTADMVYRAKLAGVSVLEF